MNPHDPDTLDRLVELGERWRPGGDLPALAGELGLDLEEARRFLQAQQVLRAYAPDVTARLGEQLGEFRLLGELGRGAMGRVYRAQRPDGAQVALKVLIADSGKGGARFAREARTLARLEHPNIVRFLDAGQEGSRPWLAMELIEGADLSEALEEGPLEPARARQIAKQVANALTHAHTHGVVHRDLKPSNVLLAGDGRAVVTDFGVARVREESGLTKTGALVGTPTFMAPEQIEGKPAGSAADVWALGTLLYTCLAGEPPFDAPSLHLLLDRIRTQPLPPLGPGVPADLEQICQACLEKAPAQRPTPQQVADVLSGDAVWRGPGLRRWVGGALLAGALLLLTAGVAVQLRTPPPTDVPPTQAVSIPWGHASLEGEPAWTLKGGRPPRMNEPALWAEAGRVADPLRGVRGESEAALSAAFAGKVQALGPGRVRVRYRPPVGCRFELQRPADSFEPRRVGERDVYERPSVEGSPSDCRIHVPDDRGLLRLRLGRSVWQGAAVDLEAMALPHPAPGAYRSLGIAIGSGPAPSAALSLVGRLGSFSVRAGEARGSGRFVLPSSWTPLRLAPGAPSGERILVGPEHPDAASLDAALTAEAPPGGVWITVGEERLALRHVSVRGAPLSVDTPALAWAPVAGTSHCGITARFRLEGGDALGGPRLELGTRSTRYVLRLEQTQLRLDRGQRVLGVAELDAPLTAGWLRLVRLGDGVRAQVWTESGLEREVFVHDPLRLGAGNVSLGYGSSGPRVWFEHVEVALGTDDPARRAHDRGEASNEASSVTRWRQASSALEALITPALGGTNAGPARRSAAADLAETLDRAAARLTGGAAADAQARATLAWVVAERPEEAKRSALRLVELEGDRAAARLDWLTVYADRPALLESLASGYALSERPRLRAAACGAVLAVGAPDATQALALQHLADLYERSNRAELALGLLDRAAALDPSDWDVRVRAARVLMKLGRAQESLERIEQANAPDTEAMPFVVRMYANAQLGRPEAAIEALAGLVARSPEYARKLIQSPRTPGGDPTPIAEWRLYPTLLRARPAHRAAFTLLLSRLPGLPTPEAKIWRDRSATHSRAATDRSGAAAISRRERGLAGYVEATAADVPSLGRMLKDTAADHPCEVLLRARLGDPQARRALAAAGRKDAFVQDLARSDEVLTRWARE